MIPDRTFKCIVPYLNFVKKDEQIVINNAEMIVTNLSDNIILSENLNKTELRDLIHLIKNLALFKEVPNYIFTVEDLINFTTWYKEDVMYPLPEQIRDAIEHWIEYQKSKIDFFEITSS